MGKANIVMVIGLFIFLQTMGAVIVYSAAPSQPEVVNKEVVIVTTEVESTQSYVEDDIEIIKETPEPKKVKKKVKKKPEPKPNGDEYLLAQIITAEAKGEPYNGKLAVGNVIMNRVNDENFPDTIKGVIFQKGQFQPVSNGSVYNSPSEKALQAAKEVLNGVRIVGNQALYFYNPNTSTSDWIFSRTTIMDIGNHRFAY
jgi:N-acetylmuramoyl-L-alanine amidase